MSNDRIFYDPDLYDLILLNRIVYIEIAIAIPVIIWIILVSAYFSYELSFTHFFILLLTLLMIPFGCVFYFSHLNSEALRKNFDDMTYKEFSL